jgi:hypothetical protein
MSRAATIASGRPPRSTARTCGRIACALVRQRPDEVVEIGPHVVAGGRAPRVAQRLHLGDGARDPDAAPASRQSGDVPPFDAGPAAVGPKACGCCRRHRDLRLPHVGDAASPLLGERRQSPPPESLMWLRTVTGESTSRRAMTAVENPCRSKSSTCHSRLVSVSYPPRPSTCRRRGPRSRNSSITRATSSGVRTASPFMTSPSVFGSCLGSMSLSRYPEAPARSDAKRSVSSRETVSITIFVWGSLALISQAAATPPPGMRTSRMQTSGDSWTAASIAPAASPASAHTTYRASASSARRMSSRVGTWSSARRTRAAELTGRGSLSSRAPGWTARPAAGTRSGAWGRG